MEQRNIVKNKNAYVVPKTRMEMTTTSNSSYKYWNGYSNDSTLKKNYNCKTKHPTCHQTTYNYCYSEPGTYSKAIKSENEDACINYCCKK